MPYEALWCIISLRTKIHEGRECPKDWNVCGNVEADAPLFSVLYSAAFIFGRISSEEIQGLLPHVMPYACRCFGSHEVCIF